MHIDIVGNRVAIVGHSCSGKSYLSSLIERDCAVCWQQCMVIHTDQYMKYTWEQALPQLVAQLKEVSNYDGIIVVEGILTYRLLRYYAEQGCDFFTTVIECRASTRIRQKRYESRDQGRSFAQLRNMEQTMNKIYSSFLKLKAYTPVKCIEAICDTPKIEFYDAN